MVGNRVIEGVMPQIDFLNVEYWDTCLLQVIKDAGFIASDTVNISTHPFEKISATSSAAVRGVTFGVGQGVIYDVVPEIIFFRRGNSCD